MAAVTLAQKLRERFPTGLRLSASGYSLKTQWGEYKRIVAVVHHGARAHADALEAFIDDAELIAEAVNFVMQADEVRATPGNFEFARSCQALHPWGQVTCALARGHDGSHGHFDVQRFVEWPSQDGGGSRLGAR